MPKYGEIFGFTSEILRKHSPHCCKRAYDDNTAGLASKEGKKSKENAKIRPTSLNFMQKIYNGRTQNERNTKTFHRNHISHRKTPMAHPKTQKPQARSEEGLKLQRTLQLGFKSEIDDAGN